MVNSGALGAESDEGILARSDFGADLLNGTFPLPNPAILPNSNICFPHFFVGDEAFALKPWLMRPYPGNNLSYQQNIFNYRLSRARRVIENAFGILVSRWRVLRKSFLVWPDSVDRITMASVCLHNFLIISQREEELIQRRLQNHVENNAVNVFENNVHSLRHQSDSYLAGPGAVPWQEIYVNRRRIADR